jgi:deazaflavin-dependent oxidoreductase (nitroreductase family)
LGWYSALSKRAVRIDPRVSVLPSRLHSWIHRLSGGRVGNTFITQRAPVLFLVTTGRRSGKRRETPLVYAKDDGRYVVAASNAGASAVPAWFHNLTAAPAAEIRVGRETIPVTHSLAGAGERERLWRELGRVYDGYAEYQEQTAREIPVVVLTPRGG